MIYIRVDGANIQEIGTGHLYRMMFLADQLFKITNVFPLFLISGYQETKDILTQNNFKYKEIDVNNEANEILKLSCSHKKDMLIIDMCDRDDRFINDLSGKYFIISFDDTKGGARYSDMVFNSVLGRSVKRNNFFYGTEYFLVRPEISKYNLREKKISSSVENLLICLGGSDPCSLNLMMVEWLNRLEFSGKVKWVLGPSVNNKDLIIKRFKNLNLDITPIIDYKYMGRLYYRSDLCICAAGFSLFEIACVGLPAITICLYPHQIPTVNKFEETGAICNLGFYKEIDGAKLKASLYALCCNQSKRASMSRKGKMFVDGLGIERVMAQINKYL